MASTASSINHLRDAGIPCLTKKAYNATYPAINPSRPELSLRGKHVVLTGAGSGIGRETAKAFAAAGAASIFLLGGRRESLLSETAGAVKKEFPNVAVNVAAANIADRKAINDAVSRHVTSWDVLVLNAAYLPHPATIVEANLDDWSMAWEINVKGNLQVIQALLPKRSENASVIGVSSNVINLPGEWTQKLSPYTITKTAFSKAFEIFAAEVPDTHFVTFHPGAGTSISSRTWRSKGFG